MRILKSSGFFPLPNSPKVALEAFSLQSESGELSRSELCRIISTEFGEGYPDMRRTPRCAPEGSCRRPRNCCWETELGAPPLGSVPLERAGLAPARCPQPGPLALPARGRARPPFTSALRTAGQGLSSPPPIGAAEVAGPLVRHDHAPVRAFPRQAG